MAMPVDLPLLSDYVTYYADLDPDREALVLGDMRWTYRDLAKQVDRLARALLANGIGTGDRVAIMGTPRPECITVLLAASSIGAITLGLNPKFPQTELDYFVGDAEPRLLLGFGQDGEGDHHDQLRTLAQAACLDRTVIFGDGMDGTLSWDGFLLEGSGVNDETVAAARDGLHPRDPALIVYTSGTTGRPKGAVLPHCGLVYCSRVQADRWDIEPLRILVNLPVNHIGYMGDMCSYAVVAGGTAVFMEKFDPVGILELIEKEKITAWGQVPTMFQITLGMPEANQVDLSSLEGVIWGGACCPTEVFEKLRALRPKKLATSYGMTETTGSVTFTAGDADDDELLNTVGTPDPRYEVRIAHPDGTPVRPGEEGEIQVRGAHIMIEYWKRPEATRETIDAEGWLHTGDVALLREDGKYAIRGRLSAMYKSGGENVYPREVELVLEDHPEVAMAAVLGVPDAVYSEVGYAFVMPSWGGEPTPESLRAFCKERLVNFKVPKHFEIRDVLPMLPIGKVDKVALKKNARAQLGQTAQQA